MSIPRRTSEAADDDVPALTPLGPVLKPAANALYDDYDPVAAIALLRHFLDDPDGDPEQQRRDFLAFARAIDEGRPLGMRHFDEQLKTSSEDKSAVSVFVPESEPETQLPYDPAAVVAMFDAFLADKTESPAAQQASLEALMEAIDEGRAEAFRKSPFR